MKVVIFAGGLGTRMREETEFKPKPMVEIGGIPILVHLIEIFARQGFTDIIVLAGYKAQYIKSYFSNFLVNLSDISLTLSEAGQEVTYQPQQSGMVATFSKGLRVSVLDTGEETLTGERLMMVQEQIGNQGFLATYGDGLASVNLKDLIMRHQQGKKMATLTVTRPSNRFGIVDLNEGGTVQGFREKPAMTDYVNMGFFVFEPSIFDLLRPNESLEEGLLTRLASQSELTAYTYDGFWQPMDTYREYEYLNSLWKDGSPLWRVPDGD